MTYKVLDNLVVRTDVVVKSITSQLVKIVS